MKYLIFLLPLFLAAQTPRTGWTLLNNAQDLRSAPSWGCLAAVRADAATLKLSSTSGYADQVNSTGPRLLVGGDFSILLRIANSTQAGGWLELYSQAPTDASTFWRGLKRVDVGVAGGNASLNIWNGEQDSPAVSRSFNLGAAVNMEVSLELARVGNQLILYTGDREVGRVPDPGVFSSGEIRFGLLTAPGNEVTITNIAAAYPAGTETTILLANPFARKAPRSGTGLRDLLAGQNFLLGAAINPAAFTKEAYYNSVGREFNLLAPENAMKWQGTQPEANRFTFCEADQIVSYAEANGQKVRGHALVWHEALPGYIANGVWTRDTLLAAMRAHILAVAGRYKGRLIAWDVVNEAIDNVAPYKLRDSIFSRVIGPDFLDFAFRYAREADPTAKLFYNDYSGEGLGAKSQAIFDLVTAMKARGVPIDGVGLQMHLSLTGSVPAAEVEQNMRRLAQAGFEIHITEMDIATPNPDSAAKQTTQSAIYKGIYRACRAVPQCTALLFWGVSDGDSWIPGFRPGNYGGLPLDAAYRNKDSYYTFQQELGGTRAPAPVIATGGVVNAASYASSPALSEGSFFSVFGANFATNVTVWDAEFVDGQAPTTLDGVRVLIDGKPAFLSLVAPGQINAIAPAGIAAGSRNVVVERNGQASGDAAITAATTTPSFFLYSPRANRYVAAITADGTALIAPTDLFGGPVGGRAVRPAKPGESIILYGTGFGATTPATGIGRLPASAAGLAGALTIRVGEATAIVDYGGRSGFAGVYQFNIRIPNLADGEYEIAAELDGVRTGSGRFVVIQK